MRYHKGWDFVSPMGTPVYPVNVGTVTSVALHPKQGDKYGKYVNLRFTKDGVDFWAFYAHLSSVLVMPGQEITSTTTVLGHVGDTGNAQGIGKKAVHLHFEFRRDSSGGKGTADRMDPVEFYGAPPYDGIFYIE